MGERFKRVKEQDKWYCEECYIAASDGVAFPLRKNIFGCANHSKAATALFYPHNHFTCVRYNLDTLSMNRPFGTKGPSRIHMGYNTVYGPSQVESEFSFSLSFFIFFLVI